MKLLTLKRRSLASGSMAAKKQDAACFAPFEGAIDDGDHSLSINGQLPHQRALSATVIVEGQIDAAQDDRWRRECSPAVPRICKPEPLRTVFPARKGFSEHVNVVLTVETQCREIPALEFLR